MSSRSLLVLALVAVGLLAFIAWFESGWESTQSQEESADRLFSFNADDATRVKITTAEGSVTLERPKDGKWKIVSPVEAAVETGVFSQLMNELEFGRSTREIPASELGAERDEMLRKFGLAPAETTIELLEDGRSHVLLIGRRVANTPHAYAKTSVAPDAPVLTIPLQAKAALARGLADLRAKAVFEPGIEQAVRIHYRVQDPGGAPREAEIAQDAGGAWMLQKPLVARADEGRVKAWLGELGRLRAKQFLDAAPADPETMGFAPPLAQFTLTLPGGAADQGLLLGKPVPEKPDLVYARRPGGGGIFTIPLKAAREITGGLDLFRDRRFLPIQPEEVEAVQIQRDGWSTEVQRDPTSNRWFMPGGREANPTAIFDLVNLVAGATVRQFVKDAASDLAPFGLDRPATKLVFQTAAKDGQPSRTWEVFLGKEEDGGVMAKSSEGPFVVKLPAAVLAGVPQDDLALRVLQVVDVDPEKVTALEVTDAAGEVATLTRQASGIFDVDIPNESVDSVRADSQISLLSRLRALRWLGPAKASYKLDRPVLRLELKSPQGATAVRIGAEVETGGRAAQVEGSDLIFEIAPRDYEFLRKRPLKTSTPGTPLVPSEVPAAPSL